MDANFIIKEPDKSWGGPWTVKKLNAFTKYVKAYLRIMKNNKFWETVYFDGFSGSGDAFKITNHSESNLFSYDELFISEDESRVYQGAAERVITLPSNNTFDYYYFVDNKLSQVEQLEKKLSLLPEIENKRIYFKKNDCNTELLDFRKNFTKKLAALLLIDPFGMNVSWDSISAFKDTRTDIWILIPSAIAVNRLLDRKCELKNIDKLSSFFGLKESEIKAIFYKKKTEDTLFYDNLANYEKIPNAIGKIAEIYIKQLSKIWKYVTDKPLVLRNTRGVILFHFVFASNNKNAVKIASQIIDRS